MMMDSTTPKLFAFVLMPFNEDFKEVYELGIKEACREAGAYCERVDEQIFEGSILERIYNQISKADIIISDMSGRNPNVFYETGYAHALGKKRVILLTQQGEDIPFDLKHYPHIIYPNIDELKQELIKRVSWYVRNPDNQLPNSGDDLELYINDIKIVNNPLFNFTIRSNLQLKLDFYNNNHFMIQESFKVGVITPLFINKNLDSKIPRLPIKLSDHANLHQIGQVGPIYPKAWESIGASLYFDFEHVQLNTNYTLTVAVYTKFGNIKYPFHAKFKEEY
jgi:hypothetical protein